MAVIGAAAGGVVAILVLVLALLKAKHRKGHAARPSQEQELGSVVVNAQVVSGTAADEAATCHEVWERGEVLSLSDVTVVKAEWGSPPQAMVDKTAEVKAKLNGGVLHIEPGVAGDNKLLKWLGDVAKGRRKVLRIYVVAARGST